MHELCVAATTGLLMLVIILFFPLYKGYFLGYFLKSNLYYYLIININITINKHWGYDNV